MRTHRLIGSRAIKYIANAMKPSFYVFHYFFPRKRFRIPSLARPRRPNHSGASIPPIVWQTNYTDAVTLPVYVNYLFNRWMAPGYEFRFVSHSERDRFIDEFYPGEISECFKRLQIGAAQADLWRVLVLKKYGGVYMDIDAHLVWPLARMIMPGLSELLVTARDGSLTNFFIASTPDNPLLDRVVCKIVENIKRDNDTDVFKVTGPKAFADAIALSEATVEGFRTVCLQGNFTNEFFQYADKPAGKWHREQQQVDIVRKQPPG
jgi:mannosyltransferase OCH1-like enzyme